MKHIIIGITVALAVVAGAHAEDGTLTVGKLRDAIENQLLSATGTVTGSAYPVKGKQEVTANILLSGTPSGGGYIEWSWIWDFNEAPAGYPTQLLNDTKPVTERAGSESGPVYSVNAKVLGGAHWGYLRGTATLAAGITVNVSQTGR